MALTDKQTQHVCLYGGGAAQCRYLDTSVYKSLLCNKLIKKKRSVIDKKVQAIISACAANHVDPMKQWQPIGTGNGCQGYLYLPTVPQGYDVAKQSP